MKSAALCVMVVTLAGCLSAPAPEGLAPAALPAGTEGVLHRMGGLPWAGEVPPALAGALGGQYRTGAPAGEPTLGVTPEGVVFMSTMRFDPVLGLPVSSVMRSTDRGLTWEDVGPRLPVGEVQNPPETFDPYVYVDPATGRVFNLDLSWPLVCSWLSWSDDDGAGWTTNPLACGTPGVNDHQTMVTSKPRTVTTSGYPNVVHYCVNRVVDSACSRSLDGGMLFSPLRSVFPGMEAIDPTFERFCGGLHGHLAASRDGILYLGKNQCGVPEVAVSEDDGTTWRRYAVTTDPEVGSQDHDIELAADDAGNVYAFWINRTGLPVLAASADHGRTWSVPMVVSPPDVTAADLPSVDAGAEGRVVVAYVGTTIKDGYANKTSKPGGGPLPTGSGQDRRLWANATWNAYLGVVTDAFRGDPAVVTVSTNDPADPVARGVCGRTRCFNEDFSGGMYDFIDLVIDAEGRPWAAFVDVCEDECAKGESENNTGVVGFVGTLRAGPSLLGGVELPLLPPQDAVASAPAGEARGAPTPSTRPHAHA